MANPKDMPRHVPHRCPACLTEPKCGFNGQLVLEGKKVPACDHHDRPVRMVPSRGL